MSFETTKDLCKSLQEHTRPDHLNLVSSKAIVLHIQIRFRFCEYVGGLLGTSPCVGAFHLQSLLLIACEEGNLYFSWSVKLFFLSIVTADLVLEVLTMEPCHITFFWPQLWSCKFLSWSEFRTYVASRLASFLLTYFRGQLYSSYFI